jgi:very-short-patch-repair endonuclease
LEYEFEKKFGRYYVDFMVGNFAIECDGEYWHSKLEDIISDSKKDKFLAARGHVVMRLTGKSIKDGSFENTLAGLKTMQLSQRP